MSTAEFRLKNRESIKQYMKVWRAENRDRRNAYNRKWRAEHRPKIKILPCITNKSLRWRDVVGFEKYQVSNWGTVRPKSPRYYRNINGITPTISPQGYPVITIYGPGRRVRINIHKIVTRAFLGARPVGYVVNHKDGNKQNPKISNLEYVAPMENSRHYHRLKARLRAERGKAKP